MKIRRKELLGMISLAIAALSWMIGMTLKVNEYPNIAAWLTVALICIPTVTFSLLMLAPKKTAIITSSVLFYIATVAIWSLIAFVISVFLGIIAIIVWLIIDSKTCPKCKKMFAMHQISKQVINKYPTTMDVKQEIRDKNGKYAGSYKQAVPATVYVFEIVRACKKCNCVRRATHQRVYRD